MEGADRAHEPGEGASLSSAAVWSGATYERLAETYRPIHERVVASLAPRAGERLLDLACGPGGVALLAAQEGAEVTGLDLSSDQLAKARAAAAEQGVDVRFDEGDCEQLPYPDASFDLVASSFGLVYAARHERAAAETARVCRPGGRLAITVWPRDGWSELGARVGREYPPGDDARLWAEESYVRDLLGDAFELRFEAGTWSVDAGSAVALWELISGSTPRLRAWLAGLECDRRAMVEGTYLDFLAGGILRRDYSLVLGVRR